MTKKVENRRAFRKMILRSFSQSAGINSETMQGLGFAFAMIPILKSLYEGDQFKRSVKRQSTFFNTYPGSIGYILGVTAKNEEEHAKNSSYENEENIYQMKISLMGPLAGLGDSLVMAIYRVIVTIIAIDFVLDKNVVSVLFYLFIFHIPYFWVRIKGAYIGYMKGPLYLQKYVDDGSIERLTKFLVAIKAALIGYLVFRGFQVSMPGKWNLIEEMLPHWLPLILVLVGVFIYKKELGKKTGIGLLLTISFILTLLLN